LRNWRTWFNQALGILYLYKKIDFHLRKEFKNA